MGYRRVSLDITTCNNANNREDNDNRNNYDSSLLVQQHGLIADKIATTTSASRSERSMKMTMSDLRAISLAV